MNPISGTPTLVEYLLAAAQILAAIVWPLLLLILVLMFQRQIRDALQNVIEASWGSAKVKFVRQGSEVAGGLVESVLEAQTSALDAARPELPQLRELYAQKAINNPLNAIIEGWLAVESWYDNVLEERGIDVRPGGRKMTTTEMAALAVERGWLPASTQSTINGLGIMRDLAVNRGGSAATTQQAQEYLVLVDGARYTLARELKPEA